MNEVTDYRRMTAAFARLHAGVDTTRFVANVDVEVHALAAGSLGLPVTVNDPSKVDAWVTSPRTTYVRYAREEARRVAPRSLVPLLMPLIGAADQAMRVAAIDRAVTIGNWMLSTNLHPPRSAADLDGSIDEAVARWPGRAIWMRSLNVVHHRDWIDALVARGFTLVPTRQVYLFDARTPPARLRHNLRMDLRRLASTSFDAVGHDDFREADFAAGAALYARLYLDKYSSFNPRYTACFLAAWHRAGLLECSGFRDAHGRLCAILGLFRLGDQVTAPIVGYDTSMPQSDGLYRLLMAQVFRATLDRGLALNLSSGAPDFKRLRGCVPAIEYSAVHARHLPRSSRVAFAALGVLTRRIGVPVMERFAL